jgi:glycosyltransferase involved in cell wall biosynthesis
MQINPPRQNVLFVTGTRCVYGAELSLLPVVRTLDQSWKPHFLIEGTGPLDTLLRESFPVYRLALSSGAALWEGYCGKAYRALCLLQLVYLLRSLRIHLVHVNLHFSSALVSRACAAVGIPIVVHVRNMIDRPVSPRFRKYDGIICISQAVRDSLIEKGQVPLHEIVKRLWVIPDGRDLSLFRAPKGDRVRHEWHIDSTVPLVGMAARITPMKGQDTFLRMAALVKQRIPTAKFVVVGSTFTTSDEPYLGDLHRLVRDLGLEDAVIFAGYRRDMPDVLAALDLFAHPSHRGAFVSVLIEAMASGIPIVASDVDGIPECVGRDGAAVLLPPNELALWADATVGILTDPNQARRMAEKGRNRASGLFDILPLARASVDVLDTVSRRYRGAQL